MKKIVCPTDFSPVANNAVEYAAALCRMLNAQLELVNVQFAQPAEVHDANTKKIPARLQLDDTCRLVRENFGIHCTGSIEAQPDTLAAAIAHAAEHADLLVMGTGGINEVYEYFFGTFAYNVVKKVSCPVFIIPEGFNFHPFKKTILAWDYHENTKDNFQGLDDIRKLMTKEIVFLHVSRHQTEASKDVFRLAKEELENKLGTGFYYQFDRVCSEDVAGCIDEYMQENDADLLVVNTYKRNFFSNLFHGQVVHELVNKANYPMLVFHTRK